MRIQFVYSAALACVVTFVAVDLTVQQLASASQEVKFETPSLLTKAGSSSAPIIIARYPKNDTSVSKQGVQDAVHCISDAYIADSDICAIAPTRIAQTKGQGAPLPKWRLAKMPLKFIWQQEMSEGRRLLVELSDDSGPLKGKTETFRNGSKENVLVTPDQTSTSQELYLSAKITDKNGNKVEDWLLPIPIEIGEAN